MAARVEDFGFVVEMTMKDEDSNFKVVAADFVAEYVGEDNSDKMENMDNIEKISHYILYPLCPWL